MRHSNKNLFITTDLDGNKKEITKEEIIHLFIELNFSQRITASKLNIAQSNLKSALRKWGIVKEHSKAVETVPKRIIIDKEEFYKLYILENRSSKELCNYYKCSRTVLMDRIKTWNMYKTGEAIQQNRTKALQEKYGVTSALKVPELKEKQIQTNLARYGTKCALQNPEIMEKRNITNIEKYGAANPLVNEAIKNKANNTRIKHFGTPCYKSSLLSSEAREIFKSEVNFKNFILESGYNTTGTIANYLNCNKSTVTEYLHKFNLWYLIDNYSSTPEKEIDNILTNLNIYHYKTKQIITPKEIDHFCPEYSMGIEFNGNFYHNDINHPIDYHQKKSLDALDKNIFLYHIFEYEWSNPDVKNNVINEITNIFNDPNYWLEHKKQDRFTINITKFNILPYLKNGYKIKNILPPNYIWCSSSGVPYFTTFKPNIKDIVFKIYDCGSVELEKEPIVEQ